MVAPARRRTRSSNAALPLRRPALALSRPARVLRLLGARGGCSRIKSSRVAVIAAEPLPVTSGESTSYSWGQLSNRRRGAAARPRAHGDRRTVRAESSAPAVRPSACGCHHVLRPAAVFWYFGGRLRRLRLWCYDLADVDGLASSWDGLEEAECSASTSKLIFPFRDRQGLADFTVSPLAFPARSRIGDRLPSSGRVSQHHCSLYSSFDRG